MKYMSRPKSAAVKDIDIDNANIIFLGQKYRYRIDIGKDDVDPPLTCSSPAIVARRKRQNLTAPPGGGGRRDVRFRRVLTRKKSVDRSLFLLPSQGTDSFL